MQQQSKKPIPVLTKPVEPILTAVTGMNPSVLSKPNTNQGVLSTRKKNPVEDKLAGKVEADADDSMVFSKKLALDDYIIGKQIGHGAYAVVRVGLHKPSNKKVAMKIYNKEKLMEPNRRRSVRREIKLLEKMQCKHVIRLYEVIDNRKYVILVMEYVPGGSLHGYLKTQPNKRLVETEAKRVFR